MRPMKAVGVDYGRIYAFVNLFNLLRYYIHNYQWFFIWTSNVD